MMRYRDLAASMDWLCNAFGFRRDCVVRSDDGSVIYAQLALGSGMVMLGPVGESEFDKLMRQPSEIGGAETQSCYLVVEDIGTHHARSKAAGAEILIDLNDDDADGRGYSCRDPGGHIWNFGTFDPWGQGPPQDDTGDQRLPSTLRRLSRTAAKMMVGGSVLALAVVAFSAYGPKQIGFRELDAPDLAAAPPGPDVMGPHQVVWSSADDGLRNKTTYDIENEARLKERERNLRTLEQAGREMRRAFSRERLAKQAAEQATRETHQQFVQERQARKRAERIALRLSEQLARERLGGRPQRDGQTDKLAAVAPSDPPTGKEPPVEPAKSLAGAEPLNAPAEEKSKVAVADPTNNETAGARREAVTNTGDEQAAVQPNNEKLTSDEVAIPTRKPYQEPVQRKNTTRQNQRKTVVRAPPKKRPPKKTAPKPWPYSAWD